MIPAVSVAAAIVVLIAIVVHRRRTAAAALAAVAERPDADVDIDALRAELEKARLSDDAERIQSIEDRIRIHEYWERRAASDQSPDRVENEPTSISDWNTNEKRFNNFR